MVAVANWFGHLSAVCGSLCDASTKQGQKVRRKWGCDSVASPPAYSVTCWACWGSSGQVASCTSCKGSGAIKLERCPAFYVGDRELKVIRAYRLYRRGHWPSPGTWSEQTNAFVQVLGLLDNAWACHEGIALERARARRT